MRLFILFSLIGELLIQSQWKLMAGGYGDQEIRIQSDPILPYSSAGDCFNDAAKIHG
jgi:hypothetical protein